MPLISLFELGSSAQLTFSTLWQADQNDLSALTDLLGQVDGAGANPQLSFAPIRSPQCRVLIGDSAGDFAPLGVSETSGYPPYQALFNFALTGVELEHARAALRGESGHLRIDYAAETHAPLYGMARLSADGVRLIAWLTERGVAAEVPSGLLEQAFEQGLIQIEINADAGNSRLWRQKLIDAAARMLPAWLSSNDVGSFDAFNLSLSEIEAQPVPLSLSTDLGALLAPTLP